MTTPELRVAVLIPCFNEEATVTRVLTAVLAQRPVQEVVVVDDASSDRTWARLQEFARTEPRVAPVDGLLRLVTA